MAFHVPNKFRVREGALASKEEDGNNGFFILKLKLQNIPKIYIQASDGFDWEHVSVSLGPKSKVPPPWHIMCMVKDLFWDAEDTVIQFHPSKSEYVNLHKGCLHLWRPIDVELPRPKSILVGPI